MTTIAEQRQALIDTLAASLPIPVGRSTKGTTPFAHVGMPRGGYRASHGATGYWGEPENPGLLFPVKIYLGTAVEVDTQETLEAYLDFTGDRSIAAIIDADRTLGGVVDDAVAESFRDLGIEEVEFYGKWGGEVSVRVLARRG